MNISIFRAENRFSSHPTKIMRTLAQQKDKAYEKNSHPR